MTNLNLGLEAATPRIETPQDQSQKLNKPEDIKAAKAEKKAFEEALAAQGLLFTAPQAQLPEKKVLTDSFSAAQFEEALKEKPVSLVASNSTSNQSLSSLLGKGEELSDTSFDTPLNAKELQLLASLDQASLKTISTPKSTSTSPLAASSTSPLTASQTQDPGKSKELKNTAELLKAQALSELQNSGSSIDPVAARLPQISKTKLAAQSQNLAQDPAELAFLSQLAQSTDGNDELSEAVALAIPSETMNPLSSKKPLKLGTGNKSETFSFENSALSASQGTAVSPKKQTVSTEDFLMNRKNNLFNSSDLSSSKKVGEEKLTSLENNKDLALASKPEFMAALSAHSQNQAPAVVSTTVNVSATQMSDSSYQMKSEDLKQVQSEINTLSQSGGGTMKIRMRPDHLGELLVQVKTDGSKVSLKIQSESVGSQRILESKLHELSEGLSQKQMTLGAVEFSQAQSVPKLENMHESQFQNNQQNFSNSSQGFDLSSGSKQSNGERNERDDNRFSLNGQKSFSNLPKGLPLGRATTSSGRLDVRI